MAQPEWIQKIHFGIALFVFMQQGLTYSCFILEETAQLYINGIRECIKHRKVKSGRRLLGMLEKLLAGEFDSFLDTMEFLNVYSSDAFRMYWQAAAKFANAARKILDEIEARGWARD